MRDVEAIAAGTIADLVMILKENNEPTARQAFDTSNMFAVPERAVFTGVQGKLFQHLTQLQRRPKVAVIPVPLCRSRKAWAA